MNVLILGADGFVGSALCHKLNPFFNLNIHSRNVAKTKKYNQNSILPTLDELTLHQFLKDNSIDFVINCVAMANVDSCDKQPKLAAKVNLELPKLLVKLSNELAFKLIHFSTNGVYNGIKPPYSELSEKIPLNLYGELKANADDYIEKNCLNYIIIRPMTIYGYASDSVRTNPVKMIINKLTNNEKMYLVNDVKNNYLYINDLAYVTLELINNRSNGTFNVSGDESLNRFELGILVANTLGFDESSITECDSSKFGSMTKRAPDTSFDNSKIKEEITFKPRSLEDAINEIYKSILKNESN